jgi:hypothetical protein
MVFWHVGQGFLSQKLTQSRQTLSRLSADKKTWDEQSIHMEMVMQL